MPSKQTFILAGAVIAGAIAIASYFNVDSARVLTPAKQEIATPASGPLPEPSVAAKASSQATPSISAEPNAPVDMTAITKYPEVGEEFLKAVRATPIDGGLRVEEVAPNSLYAKLGLQPGDVVQNLDSIFLPTPEQKREGIHPFNRPEIHLEVKRNGAPVLLRYRLTPPAQ